MVNQSINQTQLQSLLSVFELNGSCSQVHLAYWDEGEQQLIAASQRMEVWSELATNMLLSWYLAR